MTSPATVEGDARLRLFLALELPADVADALVAWRDRHLPGARVVSHLHVTLAFLGSRPSAELESILDLLRREAAAAGRIVLSPARYRETRSVGMVVLDDSGEAATRLAVRLHDGLEALDVYRREARPWLAHVTVVRFRERPRQDPPLPEIAPFAPSGLAAFLSRLHPSGARYEVLESCSLGMSESERSEPGG